MFLNLLSFFLGFILLLLTPILIYNHRIGSKLNGYFFMLLAFNGILRIMQGLETFGFVRPFINLTSKLLLFSFFIPPIYFLFFKHLLSKNNGFKKEIKYFMVAAVIVMVSKAFDLNKNINQLIFFIYSTGYLTGLIFMIRKYVFMRKNAKDQRYFSSIKTFSLIMFAVFFMIYLFANYIFNKHLYATQTEVLHQFYNRTTFIWLFIVIYILLNPVIFYDKQVLMKNLNTSLKEKIKVWNSTKVGATDKQDLKLEKKIRPNMEGLLFSLNNFENDLLLDFKEIPTLKELSFTLQFPQSHIKYVFKYYNHFSYSEYRNVIKIKYALQLIHEGYLKTQTIESLGIKCYFSDRSTFFKNFKKYVGRSPSDYLLTLIMK